MASRPIVCTQARLHVFTPCRHLATQGDASCTKQVVLRQRELGWIRDFPLAVVPCEPCDIPTSFFPWPGVTASRKAGNGSFSLTKHQGRYQLVLIVLFFVLWPEPELNPPKLNTGYWQQFSMLSDAVTWKISSGLTKAWPPGLTFASEAVFFLAALRPLGRDIYRSNLQESYSVLHLNLH